MNISIYTWLKAHSISNHYRKQYRVVLAVALGKTHWKHPNEELSWAHGKKPSEKYIECCSEPCPGNRQRVNIKHKAGTSQKASCRPHNFDILALALLFHLGVDSSCQKPHTSWAFNGFLGNIFRTFFTMPFSLLHLDLLRQVWPDLASCFPWRYRGRWDSWGSVIQ